MGQLAAIESAETVAAMRALAAGDRSLAVGCEDPFARYFLNGVRRALLGLVPKRFLRHYVNKVAPGSYPFAIARTRHFDEAVLAGVRDGIEQLVILGAGYDSRAFRFERELKGVTVYEIDHPGTQARKAAILDAEIGRRPANLKLIDVDFTRQSFADALIANGFSPEKKTLFLWEGVSYYLPQAAVDAVLAFVGRCTRGSSIVFDYAIKSFVDGDTSTFGGREIAAWLEKIGEPFLFGLEPERASTYLVRHGLRMVSNYAPDDLERMYLVTPRGDTAGRTLGHLRILRACATGLAGARTQGA